jgi:acyl-CoA-dependent ceramide synthase
MRHYLNLRIIWSEFNEFKTVGPYELDWLAEQYKCWISHVLSTALLAALQALNLFWLYYILRIAHRYVFLNVHEDDRSDDDDKEFDEEQRAEALARAAEDAAAALPRVVLNGNGNGNGAQAAGKSSAADVHTNGATNRKENKR